MIGDSESSIDHNSCTETEFAETLFHKCNLLATTLHSAVLRSTTLDNCRLKDCKFTDVLCDGVKIAGRIHKSVRFDGTTSETQKNRLRLDLSEACITWLETTGAIDLSQVVLPKDGSCFVLTDLPWSAVAIDKRLALEETEAAKQLSAQIRKWYGPGASDMRTYNRSKTTTLISRQIVMELANTRSR